MTGVAGGTLDSTTLDALIEPMHVEPWYETDRWTIGDVGLALRHHGAKDPGGWTTWQDGERAGVVHGAITNLDTLGLTPGDLFHSVLDDPASTLASLDGPFLIVAVDGDADRVVVATDKLGTLSCFYTTENGFSFGSNVASPLATLDSPTIDVRGLSDLLLIGHVWGTKTLIEEISALPPASYLEFDAGDTEVSRYFELDFDTASKDDPMTPIWEAYQDALAETAATMDGSVGIWLSGGLDSRAMAGELATHLDSMVSYTYDANPSGGGNPEIAQEISDLLGMENKQVPLGPGRFVDVFDDAVSLTNGMLTWKTFLNLTAVFNIEDPADIVLEACGQGGMMGDGIGQAAIRRNATPEEALYQAKNQTRREDVSRLLSESVDPMETYRNEVETSPAEGYEETVLDCYYRNYFPRGDFASNPLAQSQVGVRVPFAHGEFLDAMTKLPLDYRVASIPLTKGKIPAGTARAKLELARLQDRGLEKIPYERTKFPPAYPHALHVAGFVGSTAFKRLFGKTAYGGERLQSLWYRTDDELRAFIDGLLDDARERSVFDGDVIDELRAAHIAGEANNIGPLAAISTAERWFQLHLDQSEGTQKTNVGTVSDQSGGTQKTNVRTVSDQSDD